jgi:hypothetical protein
MMLRFVYRWPCALARGVDERAETVFVSACECSEQTEMIHEGGCPYGAVRFTVEPLIDVRVCLLSKSHTWST